MTTINATSKTTLKATEWPNKLGWDAKTRHGVASVANAVTCLWVQVPMSPIKVWCQNPFKGEARWINDERRRIARVPIGIDPVQAIKACQENGLVVSDSDGRPEGLDYPMLDI